MYCKECGNPLKEGDLFCTKCGAKTKEPEFTWNIYNFPEPKKTEGIDFDWSISDTEEDKGIDADMIRGIMEGGLSEETEKIGKFFTFHQKNEEFQKLLDRELERINLGHNQGESPILHKKEEENEHPIEETATIEDVPKTEDSVQEESPPLWFEQNEEEEAKAENGRKKKGFVGRIALIFVILLILAEIGVLGVRYFWPDSEATVAITKAQVSVSETFLDWKDRVVGFFESMNANEEPAVLDPSQEDPVVENPAAEDPETGIETGPSPIPVADKNTLITASASNNENITTIRANTSLAYQSNNDYKIKDINNSKPIDNNIWMETEADGVRYYDQELVSTLVSFDSKWIDYVNDSDDSVIDLVKKDSRAYQNVTTYSKVGKVEKTFLLLEIGEIRQGEKGYYVWTYEEIQEVVGSKTTLKKYHWVYYLEQEEGEMRITDYYEVVQ